jgi:hypothetical protein
VRPCRRFFPAADQQAATAAKRVNWLFAGFNVTTADIAMDRIALFTLLPQCAGLVLMLARGAANAPSGVAAAYRYSGTSRRARLGSSNGILPARH